MELVMRGVYTLAVRLAALLLPLVSRWHPGVRRWMQGRRDQALPGFPASRPVVWMHVASLGEWEQGRSILIALRTARPGCAYVVTFFSPSGFDRVQAGVEADWIGYLPLDTPGRAAQFVKALRPALVIWVKYDFWYHHWRAIRAYGAPVVLVAAVFRTGHFLGKAWAGFIRREVLSAAAIAVQDDQSLERLYSWGYPHGLLAGDSRVDRVWELSRSVWADEVLEAFAGGERVLVAGSVWPEDMELLRNAILDPVLRDWKWLIAPHDPGHFVSPEWMPATMSYSTATPHAARVNRLMVLDKVGILKYVYRYAAAAYIGGGLGRGLHNTLEPAAYSVPVLFGPMHMKFPEAGHLLRTGGAYVVSASSQCVEVISALVDAQQRKKVGDAAGAYIRSQVGATDKLLPMLLSRLDEKR